ncbi:MAG: cation transporter [Spirulinaceae cyanobacterium SM2_1_0]|nr:cation transporter [Spirulinaceae cyanobacterium SM2_1_0]
MSDCGCQLEAKNAAQRRVLGLLLVVNAAMFVLEVTTGVLAQSTALIADSLDMLADATVYGISLSVVGRSAVDKTRAAFLSGVFQITLASLVLLDVIRKFISGSRPESALMMGIGFIALTANVLCLWLLAKHRHGEVHMRASWIFSKNDVIANLSVIGAGLLVNVFQSRLPDLVIGLAIAILVLRGGIQILRAARGEQAVS